MNLKQQLTEIAKKAHSSSRFLLNLSYVKKNKVIGEMASALERSKSIIIKANKKDISNAKAKGLSLALIDRLTLNDKRIKAMVDSLRQIVKLPDPLGRILKEYKRPNGLKIRRVSVPIGVIAIIYESRPNVTSDCIGLCFKSGNSVILRGGSEAINSNLAIYSIIKKALSKYRLPEGIAQILTSTDRRAVDELLKLNDYIDLVMPRGGEGLIRKVARSSRIPVIKHYKGICHVYVDNKADLNMAIKICFNAKVQRPGVCNAMETMLVHKDAAARFLPGMIRKFIASGVQIRGCLKTQEICKGMKITKASEKDYRREYLDLILSVRVVGDIQEAIEHIARYGSGHSDSIVTEDKNSANKFLREVDSACVYVNASTRFTDGYEFGMGSEIGISTDKLHARGPMALEELTTYKYMVFGSGQIRI